MAVVARQRHGSTEVGVKADQVGVGAALDDLERPLGDGQLVVLAAAEIVDRPERVQCLEHHRIVVELLADPQRLESEPLGARGVAAKHARHRLVGEHPPTCVGSELGLGRTEPAVDLQDELLPATVEPQAAHHGRPRLIPRACRRAAREEVGRQRLPLAGSATPHQPVRKIGQHLVPGRVTRVRERGRPLEQRDRRLRGA